MRKTLTRLALAGAAVTSLIAGAALAQVPPPPAPPAPPEAPMPPPLPPLPPLPPMDMTMSMGPDMMFMHHGHAPDPEKRAQRLHDILQLRGDQDGALKTYVEATTPRIVIEKREVVKDGRKDGDRTELAERAPPTTLERLDRMTKAADAMKKRAEATRAFYTALTPAQQKTFDILGMGEGEGDKQVFVRRFETHAPMSKGDQRKIVIQKKVG